MVARSEVPREILCTHLKHATRRTHSHDGHRALPSTRYQLNCNGETRTDVSAFLDAGKKMTIPCVLHQMVSTSQTRRTLYPSKNKHIKYQAIGRRSRDLLANYRLVQLVRRFLVVRIRNKLTFGFHSSCRCDFCANLILIGDNALNTW